MPFLSGNMIVTNHVDIMSIYFLNELAADLRCRMDYYLFFHAYYSVNDTGYKPKIVSHHYYCHTFVELFQYLIEPVLYFQVNICGGLIKEKDHWTSYQSPRKENPLTLAA